jgi:hypothetical protein
MKNENEKVKTAINLALKHIRLKGFDDVFRPPLFAPQIEISSINENFEEFSKLAIKETESFIKVKNLNQKRIGPVVYSVIPKDQYAYRRVCWIDPFDLIKESLKNLP